MTDWLEPHKFKKGESGNPNGRPAGSRNRSTIVREIIEAVLDGDHMVVDGMTKSIVEKAMSGDVSAYRELMDSAYGKISDKSETTLKGDSENPLHVITSSDQDIIQRYLQQEKTNDKT